MVKEKLKPSRVILGIDNQPLMKIEWVDRDTLKPNNYNPNSVAPPEMKLLKLSIMEDGWTQPIVARRSGEIVDGFHRWTVSGDERLAEMTGGKVPVVFLDDEVSTEHQMMSTIRHNRARGSHAVLKMSDIVASLKQQGLSEDEIQERLSMEYEEVDRLLDQANMGQRLHEEKAGEFNQGWVPSDIDG